MIRLQNGDGLLPLLESYMPDLLPDKGILRVADDGLSLLGQSLVRMPSLSLQVMGLRSRLNDSIDQRLGTSLSDRPVNQFDIDVQVWLRPV